MTLLAAGPSDASRLRTRAGYRVGHTSRNIAVHAPAGVIADELARGDRGCEYLLDGERQAVAVSEQRADRRGQFRHTQAGRSHVADSGRTEPRDLDGGGGATRQH